MFQNGTKKNQATGNAGANSMYGWKVHRQLKRVVHLQNRTREVQRKNPQAVSSSEVHRNPKDHGKNSPTTSISPTGEDDEEGGTS